MLGISDAFFVVDFVVGVGVDDGVVGGIEIALEPYVRDELRKNSDSVVTVLIEELVVATSKSLRVDGIVVSTVVKLINCDTIGTPAKYYSNFRCLIIPCVNVAAFSTLKRCVFKNDCPVEDCITN